ncbi:MAG: bifunctional folylpolyglutamate synthase/dihydrofolate synthase [Planctomycetaceae bacterium]|nr:bifunctional folylpolyglutamate synthase/dihydrofolate synthase [Planctomycetaceae bacterium]
MIPRAENYEQAIEFLFSRVNYERLSGALYSVDDFKLDRMRDLLARLGNPQLRLPVVHIAGTKGKGSTAAFIAAALTAAGRRTGLFTSPHLAAFEERMAVDGVIPTHEQLAELVNLAAGSVAALDETPGRMSPTYFEIATAMAWLYFRRMHAEIAVLEVGMGGRLDATNVCRPAVTAITTISRDHTRQLGSRIEQIAREKAGIIKPQIPVVSGVTAPEAQEVIAEVCASQRAPLRQLGRDFSYAYEVPTGDALPHVSVRTWRRNWNRLPLALVGEHQAANAACAVAALELLDEQGWAIAAPAVASALGNLRWPGRIEVVARRPTVIVDAAHNWAAVAALLKTLDESFPARRRLLIFASTGDKDVSGMLRQLLPRFDCVVLTSFQNNPRNLPVETLLPLARSLGDRPLHTAADPAGAWKLARRLTGPDDLICATGSFFIAAELRELILSELGSEAPLPTTDKARSSARIADSGMHLPREGEAAIALPPAAEGLAPLPHDTDARPAAQNH